MHEATTGATGRVDVTVVVPTFRGADHIATCLRSLADQTLSADRYEVVVVQNGPSDDTGDVVDAVCAAHPQFRVRRIALGQAGVGRARNIGLTAARGDYVTFVDDDDTVSPEYLQTLLRHSGPNTVGLAQFADVTAGSPPDFAVAYNRAQLARDEAVVPAEQLPSSLAYTVGKMIPTALARSVGFDLDLRSGEDIVFWVRALARAPFLFGLCPVGSHAVYYRTVRPNSVSRQVLSYDFNVVQRLDVIARLETLPAPAAAARTVIKHMTSSQTGLINRFLREHPDRHRDVIDEIRRRGLQSISMKRLNHGVARDLAILYVALPYADTSALVAARRIRKAGTVLDVVSSDMSTLRGTDELAHEIWHEFIDQVAQTRTLPTSAGWPRIGDFCRAGMERIQAWEDVKGPYRSVYSRAMWPAAHVLAALYKVRNPGTPWLAEFSDPLLHGIDGEERPTAGTGDAALLDELRAGLLARGVTPPEGDNVYLWVESLAYALADTVLFTNDHQRDYMLGYCADPALAQRALEHSVVEAHPTLPPEFYQLAQTTYPLDPSVVNLAYFGVFYATRGLVEVVGALQALAPDVRARVRLHVFTAKPDVLAQEMAEVGLDDVVIANGYVSYLEFLKLSTLFDALLVNDARTADSHHLNPYMPSKWSDYAGSGQPIWGIVEPGSVMSTRPLAFRSPLGDVDGARAVIEELVQTHARAGHPFEPSVA